ncbi:hypothetical protein J3L11_17685 [Shewanella sp. 4t3-1-2LB]|uniref:hypothetical protein n=1 Tax=Shewanella sp. 4t3-1-2LB TaxID=2817682 RepID=UPI001A984084|nr:hypothetical protein [Shewanella sp. 4t3-1-2LB]MBO1273471.1 hypothetical protein [Shewanella sp. 4t3-1-2LB]
MVFQPQVIIDHQQKLNARQLWRYLFPVALFHIVIAAYLSYKTTPPTLTPTIIGTPTPIHAFLYQTPAKNIAVSTPQATTNSTVKTLPTTQRLDMRQTAEKPPQPHHDNSTAKTTISATAHKTPNASATANPPETTAVKTSDIRNITVRYLQQQQLETLNQIATEHARQQTAHKTLSVMTPDPASLVLPTLPMGERNGSLDSPLDPNRIVKQGDTCYRVVKTPTQLNPDAENLGFPFKCAPTDDEKLLDASLKKRIDQHR